MALKDSAVRQAKPRERAYNLWDGGGLYLTVAPTGARWWRFKYRYAGKERRIGLGPYPDVSLVSARLARDRARLTLRDGRDPGAERRAAQSKQREAAANSFEAVAREWLAIKDPGWVEAQQKKERRRLELHAFPWIGAKPIAELKAADIKPLLTRLTKRGCTDAAHRLRQQISAVFRFAGADDRVERDPAASLANTLPERTPRNFASLTNENDVGALLRAIETFNGQFPTACALKLAPLTFVRPGELRGARWEEFDLDAAEWRIAASRRKLRKRLKEDPKASPHIVPLSTQAVAILRELKPLTDSGEFLFPGARDRRRPMSDATVNAALARLGYDGSVMTGHGMRHMASTLLHELGFEPDIIEAQLSHKVTGIRGVYNKAQHMAARREMMQAWADYLGKIRESYVVASSSRDSRRTT